jgi:hypothetical protein
VYVKIDIETPSNTTKNDYLLLKATSFDPAMGSSSGDKQELKK